MIQASKTIPIWQESALGSRNLEKNKLLTAEKMDTLIYDEKFKALVNHTLLSMMQKQEIHHLYDKWFMNPIPPLGNIA